MMSSVQTEYPHVKKSQVYNILGTGYDPT